MLQQQILGFDLRPKKGTFVCDSSSSSSSSSSYFPFLCTAIHKVASFSSSLPWLLPKLVTGLFV